MIEKAGIDVMSKVADALKGKATEVKSQNEIAQQLTQQESFRLGELSGREFRENNILKQRENQAAGELRNILDQESQILGKDGLPETTSHSNDFEDSLLDSDELDSDASKDNNQENIKSKEPIENKDATEPTTEDEKSQIVKNKEDGCRREEETINELKEQFPEEEGYKVLRERDLLDKDGRPVKDHDSGEGRRIDIVVVNEKKGNAERVIEVTSPSADKEAQKAKEERIRENGGVFVRDPDTGQLYDVSKQKTEEIRRA